MGDVLEVVGVPVDNVDYVIVNYGSGSATCWLWLRYADKTDFSAYDLPKYETPATPTPTFTATPDFDWNATWTIWVASDTYTVTITESGDTISGTFDVGGGDTVSISGSLSDNRQVASGTWVHSTVGTGTFQWQIKSGNKNQFVGNNNGTAQWCGAKHGASQPSPCMWP